MAVTLEHPFSWSSPSARLREVGIEDDSLRDGLQGAFVHHPSLAVKRELLALTAAVGTQAAMLGFPSSSASSFDECVALAEHIDRAELPIVPRFLALAEPTSIDAVVAVDRTAQRDVWADFFIGCSPLRRAVEGWTMAEIRARVVAASAAATAGGTRFGISLEDASRTPPDELAELVAVAVGAGAEVVTVCDTVGDATPVGAARLVGAVREAVDAASGDARGPVDIWWHGHNDRGLALANALGAAEAGAATISGSFLGLGERCGNTSLEQVVMFLHQAGHPGFDVAALVPYCARLAEATHTTVPANLPLVGEQAFATCTGTHVAALLKARELGDDAEDLVFSSVPARRLGRSQAILVGPTSGRAAARHCLRLLGIEPSDENALVVLERAKAASSYLRPSEIRDLFPADATDTETGAPWSRRA